MESSPNNLGEKRADRDENGRLLPGHAPLPGAGRPKGLSIKELVRKHLEENPQDLQEFVKHFVKKNKELAWQMLEGSPPKSVDVTSGGEVIPILHVPKDTSDGAGTEPQ